MNNDGDAVSPVSPEDKQPEQTAEQGGSGASAEQKIRSGSQKAKESMKKSFGSPAMQKACQWLAFAAAIVMTVGQASADFWHYHNSAGAVFRFLFFLFVTVLICMSPFHVAVIENFSKKYVGCTYYPIGQGLLLFCMSCYVYPWFVKNMQADAIVPSVFGLVALVLSVLVFLCGLFGGN